MAMPLAAADETDHHAVTLLAPGSLVGLPGESFKLVVDCGYPHGGFDDGRVGAIEIATAVWHRRAWLLLLETR